LNFAHYSSVWKFLKSEMVVMLGLLDDASSTDAQIAEMYGLNKGTVASVRRRLVDAGALCYSNIPAFNKLGCEMICCHFGSTDPALSQDVKTGHYMEFCDSQPSIFNGLIGGNSVVFFTAFKNATELETFNLARNRFFSGVKRLSKADFRTVMFPYAVSRGSYTTNFAPLVHDFFKLEVPQPKPRPVVHVDVETPDLGETERNVLVSMVENPGGSDREIAARVKLSRQAVTRVRNRLVEDGFVTLKCLPRLYKWGFEIYAVANARFNMDMPWDKRLKGQPRPPVDFSFFTLSKPDESVSNYMVPRFQDYAESLESAMAWYHKAKAFDAKPDINVFALERCTELRNFEFAPIVNHLLSGN